MGIGSAAITFNIDFVLDGLQIRKYFDAIVSADEVEHSTPDPETYTKRAERLNIGYIDCLVFEDAPKGAEAAQNAGMDCVVVNLLLRLVHFLWHGYFMHNWLGIFSYNAGLSLVHS